MSSKAEMHKRFEGAICKIHSWGNTKINFAKNADGGYKNSQWNERLEIWKACQNEIQHEIDGLKIRIDQLDSLVQSYKSRYYDERDENEKLRSENRRLESLITSGPSGYQPNNKGGIISPPPKE